MKAACMIAAINDYNSFMPAGRTHDRITLWSLPWVAGCSFAFSRDSKLTLLLCGAFLFAGLMFGPDLDISSRQFKRWGWLKCIWIPYQKSMRHRSFLSHGPGVGTVLRLIYLGAWMSMPVILGLAVVSQFHPLPWNWPFILRTVARSLGEHRAECLVIWIGLELGAMSHSLSDWGGSFIKRYRKKG